MANTEIELKFLLDEATEKRLRRAGSVGDIGAGPASTTTLVTIYYDTAERALQRAGIALRLRRKGRRWVQTVKAGRLLRAGLSEATELDCPAPGGRLALDAIPDAGIRKDVKERVNGHALSPVFRTEMRRTARRLTVPDLGEVELAIDAGQVVAGDRTAPLHEAELELLSGKPHAVFEAARALFPKGGMRFSNLTKAERGALLADHGVIDLPLKPRTAKAVAVSKAMTTEAAGREILGECLDQIQANLAVVMASDDPEGPHQLRIGLRRLRTALTLLRPAMGCPGFKILNAEARWLGREVGRLRDLDVAGAELVAAEAERSNDPGFALLTAAMEQATLAERADLRALLAEGRGQRLVLDLAQCVTTRGWLAPQDYDQTDRLARPIQETAAKALNAALKRAARRARGIGTLSIPARHDLRKALKKLRYTTEFAAPLFPAKKARPFLKRLKALQTVFGDLNDAAMAEALLCGPAAPAGGDPEAMRAAGRVIGGLSARADLAWDGAKSRWRTFSETAPFWH
ncbi:MAG: CHAD domain-containing protein [Pseudomonadota bacterium]